MLKSNRIVITAMAVWAFAQVQAQDIKDEVIDVTRPYMPDVSGAEKLKEPQSPADSATVEKKPVTYSIQSVPVASTFEPQKGRATEPEKERAGTLYPSYATLGLGNFTSILGELYTSTEINDTDRVGLFLSHRSAGDGIDDVPLDHGFSDTGLDVHYTSRQQSMTYKADFGALYQRYNWYGLPDELIQDPLFEAGAIDPGHALYGASLGGSVSSDGEYSIFKDADLRLRAFGDSYSSSEFNATVDAHFLFETAGDTKIGLPVAFDYLNGGFDRSYESVDEGLDYGYFIGGVAPYFQFETGDLILRVGGALFYESDTRESENNARIYPRALATYNMSESFVLYGGIDGGLRQNTYYGLSQQNPFVSPTLTIAPTSTAFDVSGGIRGSFSDMFGYDLNASFKREENRPLFTKNRFVPLSGDRDNYHHGNSFGLHYTDMNTLELSGKLQAAVADNVNIGLSASVFNYDVDESDELSPAEAWNLPDLNISLFADFKFLEKGFAGAELFFVGERQDISGLPSPNGDIQKVTVDSFFDLNLHVGYHITDRFTAFLRGHNLTGENYERWADFPVLGAQVLGGVTYRFDW